MGCVSLIHQCIHPSSHERALGCWRYQTHTTSPYFGKCNITSLIGTASTISFVMLLQILLRILLAFLLLVCEREVVFLVLILKKLLLKFFGVVENFKLTNVAILFYRLPAISALKQHIKLRKHSGLRLSC